MAMRMQAWTPRNGNKRKSKKEEKSPDRKQFTSPAKRNGTRIKERTSHSGNGVHTVSGASARVQYTKEIRRRRRKSSRKYQ